MTTQVFVLEVFPFSFSHIMLFLSTIKGKLRKLLDLFHNWLSGVSDCNPHWEARTTGDT